MRQLVILFLLFQVIALNAQNKQSQSLSTPSFIELPEVTVVYENIYDIYRKAARNLKEKLIRDREIAYRVKGKETEEKTAQERSLDVLFTARLEKSNAKKNRLKYKFMLSDLKHSPDASESIIMMRNRYCVSLFFDNIPAEIRQSKANTIIWNDSLIYISDRSNQSKEIVLYTICKKDSTLIRIDIEKITDDDEEYSSRITFKSKRLIGNISVEYLKNSDGYYLGNYQIKGSRFFLFRKTEKEELVSMDYQIKASPDTVVATYTEFKPSTYKVYRKPNTSEKD